MKFKSLFLVISVLAFTYGHGFSQTNPVTSHTRAREQYQPLEKGVLGTYASPPLLPNGRVDIHRLISELKDIHANTYNWLIWRKNSGDFDELRHFLPLARKAGIKVWVTLVPPSEAPPSRPFLLDYDQWATKLAVLSIKEPNLVAWNIDDFSSNLKFFTPGYVKEFLSKAHAINPKFSFVPTCYFNPITESFAEKYGHLLGGILFPYRAGSAGHADLKNPALVASEIAKIRNLLGPGIPIIVDVYVATLYHHEDTTPEYVQEVIDASLKHADGVMIYTNQDPVKNAGKYNIIKSAFKKASR